MSYAVIFPGQGSQSVGMLAELNEQYGVVKSTFDEASDVLGYDLWQLVQSGPEETLSKTDITQPAMLSAGIACYRVWLEQVSEKPAFMAGHSLGEYTALVAAGALSFAEAVSLVEARGRFMQSAVAEGEGAMAAVLGLEDEQIISICEGTEGVVEAVNFNSPGQVVVAGSSQSVAKALVKFEEAGAKRVVPLAVSVPSHCSLMKPAAEELSDRLNAVDIRMPEIKVVHNVNVQVSVSESDIRQALVEQLYRPVQWVKTIQFLKDSGVEALIEAGPGKVLTGLNRRIDKKMPVFPIYDADSLIKAAQSH